MLIIPLNSTRFDRIISSIELEYFTEIDLNLNSSQYHQDSVLNKILGDARKKLLNAAGYLFTDRFEKLKKLLF